MFLTCCRLSQFEHVPYVYVNVLFGSKRLKYAKRWSKIRKLENVVTHSSFSLLQRIPLKMLLNASNTFQKWRQLYLVSKVVKWIFSWICYSWSLEEATYSHYFLKHVKIVFSLKPVKSNTANTHCFQNCNLSSIIFIGQKI